MKITIRSDLSTEDPTLADRGLSFAHIGENLEKFKTILSDPYHPDTNPDGFINMGTAENVRSGFGDLSPSPVFSENRS